MLKIFLPYEIPEYKHQAKPNKEKHACNGQCFFPGFWPEHIRNIVETKTSVRLKPHFITFAPESIEIIDT